jgi:hypothetical protein
VGVRRVNRLRFVLATGHQHVVFAHGSADRKWWGGTVAFQNGRPAGRPASDWRAIEITAVSSAALDSVRVTLACVGPVRAAGLGPTR